MGLDLREHNPYLGVLVFLLLHLELDVFLDVKEEEQDLDRDDYRDVGDRIAFEEILEDDRDKGKDAVGCEGRLLTDLQLLMGDRGYEDDREHQELISLT